MSKAGRFILVLSVALVGAAAAFSANPRNGAIAATAPVSPGGPPPQPSSFALAASAAARDSAVEAPAPRSPSSGVRSRDDDDGALAGRRRDAAPPPAARLLLAGAALSLAVLLASPQAATVFPGGGVANADEWGRETEAPTLFTGETVMICRRRGPLGACVETAVRTPENDNDRALGYFKDPSAEVKKRQESSLRTLNEDSEGNALIQKLRKQSADNKEKNDDIVRQRTLLNDQGASFGPFDRQVVILNTDGKTFTLLQNPQAMRLKKAGYIEDRRFVIQPSREVIDDALEGKNEFGDAIKGFFGGGGGGDVGQEARVEEIAVGSTVVAEESVAAVDDAKAESSIDTAAVTSD